MNLLLTSVSAKVNLVKMFKDAAKPWGVGVYGCDIVSQPSTLDIVDQFLTVLPVSHPNYVDDLIAQCKASEINLIIPTRDGDILVLARSHNKFLNAGIRLMAADIDMVQICQNKTYFNDWLYRFGYPALQAFEAKKITKDDLPLFSRPLTGSASVGCYVIRDMADFQADGLNIITNLITAPEYSIDVLMDLQSKPLQAVVRSRDKIVDGEAKISTVIKHDHLTEMALEMATELRLVGHNLLQAFELPNGDFVFFDVNMRFGGASDLSVKAGLDSPARLLSMVYGSLQEKRAAKKPRTISYGMQLNRGADNPFTYVENGVTL